VKKPQKVALKFHGFYKITVGILMFFFSATKIYYISNSNFDKKKISVRFLQVFLLLTKKVQNSPSFAPFFG
jgi:hypothetical protein